MSEKIVVQGALHVGCELELVQAAQRPSARDSFFDVGRPRGMAAVDYAPSLARPGELSMQRLSYSLKETDRKIYIVDDGLSASYGIFGAPGSGKTYLVMYLLEQIMALHKDEPALKYGGLILDPKGVLIDDVRQVLKEIGREGDLVVLNTAELVETGKAVNVINSGLDPYELGEQLVKAALSYGINTSDPYWINAWRNLFGAAVYLLSRGNNLVALSELLDAVLVDTMDDRLDSTEPDLPIKSLARDLLNRLNEFSADDKRDVKLAVEYIRKFFEKREESVSTVATVSEIIRSAYSSFQRSKYQCYSRTDTSKELAKQQSFYDQAIEEGKIILISLSPAESTVAKILCTLVKCLFQRCVLSRLNPRFKNHKRPLIIACDEYSEVASEVPGQVGDGDFFSQARQFGCMGLLATQSVNVLQASSLKENWRAIFSTFGAKIFMRAMDNETAEEATKLSGEDDWYITSQGTSRGKDGFSSSTQKDMRERKVLPTSVLTQVFTRGDAVILGSLDGAAGQRVRFVRVQKDQGPT